MQPVFHKYDIWRHFYKTPYIVLNQRISVNKFYDGNNIKTFKYLDFENKIDEFIDLLQCHYIESDRVLVTASKETFRSYFTGQNNTSFISIYREKVNENIDNQMLLVKPPILGCISSRAINVFFENIKSSVYFIDHICIHRNFKSKSNYKNIVYKLIQTHEYNQRYKNPDIKISLFKKEMDLIEGVVPLIKYNKYLFHLHPLTKRPILPSHTTCVRILKTNLDLILDFLVNVRSIFTFGAISDIGNITTLINNNEIYIYCLLKGKQKLAYYFFKNSQIQYEDIGGNVFEFMGSYNNTKSGDLFFSGFLYAINSIRKVHIFHMLLYENVSHNVYLLDRMLKCHHIILQNECVYYLHNYIIPKSPLIADDCFFLF